MDMCNSENASRSLWQFEPSKHTDVSQNRSMFEKGQMDHRRLKKEQSRLQSAETNPGATPHYITYSYLFDFLCDCFVSAAAEVRK